MLGLFRSRPAPGPVTAYLEVAHEGRSYRVAVRRVHRARRYTLRVRAAMLDAVLTMPPSGSIRAARDFAARHAEWIGKRLELLPQKVPFVVGATIPLRGADTPIVLRPGLRNVAWLAPVEQPDGTMQLAICVAGTPEQQQKRVMDLLRREARQDLEAAVRRHTAALGKPARSITLRDTRSRWGSCTAIGALNFSWRLIMAPPHVLDYLAAHEVAHLAHMDHSDAYWRVASRLFPDLAVAEAWLKQFGTGLHRYG